MTTPDEFEALFRAQYEKLPPSVTAKLENVDFVIAAEPTRAQLLEHGMRRGEDLLGLYEGLPLDSRGVDYVAALPDKITIFRNPHLRAAEEDGEEPLDVLLYETILHEIGHHFGFGEDEILELEERRRARRR